MGNKRLGHGSARDGVHHRRFHFNKSACVQRAPQRLHQFAALHEDFAHIRIHHQIDVALSVAQFHVGEAMPFFRERKQVFCQECKFVGVDAELARPGAKEITAHADVIAQVEQLVDFKPLFADRIFLDVSLQALAVLLQLGEPGLAHEANGQDSAGDPDVDAGRFQLFRGFGGELRENLRRRMRELIAPRIRFLPQRLQLLQLLAPKLIDLFVQCQESRLVCESSMSQLLWV